MKKNKFTLQILVFGLLVTSFMACDNDFSALESDVINSNNANSFIIDSETSNIITYTKPLGPVQSNEFGANLSTLGVYDDIYGRTTASFVTQLSPTTFDPVFEDITVIDSVVVTIPFFSTISDYDEDGNIIYDVDSILPNIEDYKDIKLRIFQNNYFIRDFDPNGDFNESQAYFSNKTASTSEPITNLEGEELSFVDYDDETGLIMSPASNIISINSNGYQLKDVNNLDDDGNKTLIETKTPGIRVMLDPTFWQNKIIDKEGDPVLSSQNNFAEYFRGLYFKAEPNDNDEGSFLILNTGSTNANITIYYKETDEAGVEDTSTYVLNFGSNKINFLDNDFTFPIPQSNSETGDEKIYLKGGEGFVAGIKLFDGIDEESGMTKFEKFRNDYVNLLNGEFESSKRLVNEANLVFHVDQVTNPINEPNRLYLYDIDNNQPLVDYYLDGVNNVLPSFSILNHLGPLERVDEDDPTSAGVKYKFRITEHINNLLLRDSTNVELGLAVSLNVNLEETVAQRKVQTNPDINFKTPTSSTISPRGIILYGNNTNDNSKKVYLEIYYTEPN
ncbi:DUF4270 domain-containing protein [Winogradskyella litoriviva]|uniref:DUF4270 domain-containing protein n=1 Tax=Winogradskyella litoriviva TaxID=1220182 RepID=A0ABX2E109_9FLAO|nr:DUF4270 domain-containing protein [Winogradskyella litoriviva]NRD22005.1 DUF4270 domain-containing protein [Winogradskyella litoriviva]